MGIVYFIQPYEFLNTNIYKIGRSKLDNLSRCINGYKEGSKTYNIYHTLENVKLEKIIIKAFKDKFKLAQGREYFEGDFNEMYNIFNNICFDFNKTLYLENKEERKEINQKKDNTTKLKTTKKDNNLNYKIIRNENIKNILNTTKQNKIKIDNENEKDKINKKKKPVEHICPNCKKVFNKKST